MTETSRILIVEDDPSLVELLRYNLENEGFDVAVARDGEAGLEAVDSDIPDLVVLDWMPPNVSGIEICRQLRQKSMQLVAAQIYLVRSRWRSDSAGHLPVVTAPAAYPGDQIDSAVVLGRVIHS